ncbi:MAG: PAS domain S-box protein [Eubacteriales bacterium]
MGAILVMSCVAERKRVENTLREQLHFMQQIIGTIPNPVFYKDIKGLYRGCNSAFEEFIGLNKEKIVGKSVYEIYPKDLADKYYEMDTALFREPGVQVYENSILHTDGTRHDVIFNNATYLDSNGRLAGLVGVIVDITERKRLEKEMARLDRLNLIREIAAGIAHEIRNPMTVVRGFLQMLMFKEDDTKRREYFNLMIKELDSANSIITQFLSLARNKGVDPAGGGSFPDSLIQYL